MTKTPDFQVIEYTARLSGGAGEGRFLKAYTGYDKRLVAALKTRTNARFGKDKDGRAYWSTSAESRHADTFRELIAEAGDRAAAPAILREAGFHGAARQAQAAAPRGTSGGGSRIFPGLRGFEEGEL